jgi:CubicO group peptidase (beta-lactamase class C family)
MFALLLSVIAGWPASASPQTPTTVGTEYPPATHFPYVTPDGAGETGTALAPLANLVTGWIEAGEVVGGEVLVVLGRRIVYHEAFGWRDRERGLAWERNTIGRIRSMTKPFVGTAIQMLADEGRLTLADPVARYLPSFDNERSGAITIEQLLHHVGGFTQPGYPAPLRSYGSLRESVDAVGEAGPAHEPGTRYFYSDAGSATLAAIVAEISGMPAETFIETRILEPLGLASTMMNLTLEDPRRPRVSSTYRRVGDSTFVKYWDATAPQLLTFFRGSGGMYSSVTDYARFLAFWMDRGAANGARLLSEEAVWRALTPSGMRSGSAEYGMQWELHGRADSIMAAGQLPPFGHGGSDGTFAWADPRHDLIVVYFTQSRGGRTTRQVVPMVMGALRLQP